MPGPVLATVEKCKLKHCQARGGRRADPRQGARFQGGAYHYMLWYSLFEVGKWQKESRLTMQNKRKH